MQKPYKELDELEQAIENLISERDKLKESNAELLEALQYWLPTEEKMMDRFPRTDAVCTKHWGEFYKAQSLIAKARAL